MNVNNLSFLNSNASLESTGTATSNAQGSAQGMSEEFLALLNQEISPETSDADIMAMLKSMPVEDVNQLVKTLSEEVNAQKTGQDQIVADLLSQFDSKESLVKAMEENPKLADLVKSANQKLLNENPVLKEFIKNNDSKQKQDLKLVNTNDDFVEMKNQMNKKMSLNSSVGAFKDPSSTSMIQMKNIDSSMLDVQDETLTADSNTSSDETILTMKLDTTNLKSNDMNNTKVMDINSIQNAEDSEQMISKIQDYIVQSKVSGEKSVEMSFMHKDLGQINLQVEKINANQIQVSIMSTSSEGAKFFKDNQALLSASLASSGLDVSQIKLESSSSSSSFEFEQREGESQQFGKDNEQRQNSKDHKRRHELWKALSQDQVA